MSAVTNLDLNPGDFLVFSSPMNNLYPQINVFKIESSKHL